MLDFQGAARPRSAGAIQSAADQFGCDVATVEALIDVEAAGCGFDHAGRPKMLFEPHLFWKNLSGAERDAAVQAGLAYPTWRPGDHPPDSYPRLYKAIEINEDAALNSCSWGLPQILGENHAPAGYATAHDMVAAFCDGEDEQIAAMVRFICARNLHVYLQARNWAAFARSYNGPAYARNDYDSKLAAAYAKYAAGELRPLNTEPPPQPRAAGWQGLINALLVLIARNLLQAFARWLRSGR